MKKINSYLKYALLILAIISFLLLVSCSAIEDGITAVDEAFGTMDKEQERSETHTTLEELIPAVCELSIDEAIEQYFDRYYHITGTVKQIGSINETNMIILDGPKFAGSDYGVTFFFDGSSSIDVLKELQG